MNTYETFSHRKLVTFLTCQRRFQLRYRLGLPWPQPPQLEAWRQAALRGKRFHRMLERHFLSLLPEDEGELPAVDRKLAAWQRIFQTQGPVIPPGQRLPELTLTVPIGEHWLTGRFDLLVLGDAAAHIYDWKTESRPRSREELAHDWQTILYLALLAEGGRALTPDASPIEPEAIQLTYWFVHAPAQPVTFRYSMAAHQENLTQILALIDEIGARDNAGGESSAIWPLTDDLESCGRCAFAVLCGRQDAARTTPLTWELEEELPAQLQ